jgi:hypothetical protein
MRQLQSAQTAAQRLPYLRILPRQESSGLSQEGGKETEKSQGKSGGSEIIRF